MDTRDVDSMDTANTGEDGWDDRASDLMDQFAEGSVFLGGATHDGEGPYSAWAVVDTGDLHPRKRVGKCIVA